MVHPPATALAAELATVLASEPSGLTGRTLSNRVRRRRADVLEVLHSDPRFQHTGRGRGSRWRLATRVPPDAWREHTGTESPCCRYCGQPLPPRPPAERTGNAGGERDA
jgi:hypothetical protein